MAGLKISVLALLAFLMQAAGLVLNNGQNRLHSRAIWSASIPLDPHEPTVPIYYTQEQPPALQENQLQHRWLLQIADQRAQQRNSIVSSPPSQVLSELRIKEAAIDAAAPNNLLRLLKQSIPPGKLGQPTQDGDVKFEISGELDRALDRIIDAAIAGAIAVANADKMTYVLNKNLR